MKPVDPKVYDFAKWALDEMADIIEDDVQELAEEIQACIEGFIDYLGKAAKERAEGK